MSKVKICGITNLEDAMLACELGADALGFIFYEKSPRHILLEKAKTIMKSLPPFVTKIGVFVNMELKELNRVCKNLQIDLVQLHGDETPDYCGQVNVPCLKVFRVKNNFDVAILQDYQTRGFLLDTFQTNNYGGTGETFDWNIAKKAKKYGNIVLSGGLNPGNILEALNFVNPYAVDVCSGVEAFPGKKDPVKLKTLFEEIGQFNLSGQTESS